jgi:Fe-S-cluster containining protein
MTEKEYSHSLKLNREIAYQGKIGRRREDFCVNYIRRKKALLSRIQREVFERIEGRTEEITCQEGCSFCCVLYIEANIQECEAIVYHLYDNHDALSIFLQQYPQWRDRMRQSGDIFERCEQALYDNRNSGENSSTQQALADALLFYKMQNIPCPFLYSELCTIYKVRPYTCANHYVTTPAEWCSPLNPNQPKVYETMMDDAVFDLTFYYHGLSKPLITLVPLTVYAILNSGFSYLCRVTGLEGLEYEVMNDPEIIKILQDSGAL